MLAVLSAILIDREIVGTRRLTAAFTGPPRGLGFQENPGSAAPVQRLLGGPASHLGVNGGRSSSYLSVTVKPKTR
jgi:hypothetical protein